MNADAPAGRGQPVAATGPHALPASAAADAGTTVSPTAAASAVDTVPQGTTAPIGRWCMEHDERNSFVFTYIALSIVLSVMAGLFWLVMLVGVHFALELYRNRELARASRVAHATFGIKLDVTLVLMALALSLYMDLLFAALGLRALPRAGAAVGRLSGRLPSLRRIVRAALLLTDEVVRIAAYITAARGISGAKSGSSVVWKPHSPWTASWNVGTRVIMGLGVMALLLLLAAPWLSGHGLDGTLAILIDELSPFAR
jgi:hypothetical protein